MHTAELAGIPILLLTCSLALAQPRIGPLRVRQSTAALFGALLMVLVGALPRDEVILALRFLAAPVATIAALMVITNIAERAGLFKVLAWQLAEAARGDARRLFFLIFVLAAATGTFFTNDAAVLIFTPLVWRIIEEVGPEWTPQQKLPYYFAVLYVANVAAALIISNPINLVVADLFDIGFLEYARWMLLPAIVSLAVTYAGLRWFFARSLPATFVIPERDRLPLTHDIKVAAGLLAAVLGAFLVGALFALPVWALAAGAALIMLVWAGARRLSPAAAVRDVGWGELTFIVGMFLVALGLKNTGVTGWIAGLLQAAAQNGALALQMASAGLAALGSSLINNHPTANLMALGIQQMAVPAGSAQAGKVVALAALIGGDLGPKMLPIGSLAALLWFRILRRQGVEVSYRLYMQVGVPVTLAAIVLAVLTLYAESLLLR